MWPYAEEINFPARFILPSLNWYGDGTTDDNINSSSLKENIQIDIVRNNIVVFYPGENVLLAKLVVLNADEKI